METSEILFRLFSIALVVETAKIKKNNNIAITTNFEETLEKMRHNFRKILRTLKIFVRNSGKISENF